MKLIPAPKQMWQTEELIRKRTVSVRNTCPDERLWKAVQKLPVDDNGLPLTLIVGAGEEECYVLDVNQEEIRITASGAKGAFYALQTLRQLLENETLYVCHIEDNPDFAYRGFYHDITRGKVPTLDTLKALVDQMAYWKLNSLQLYVEHTFAFAEYADSIERTGYLTAEEIKELDDYCYENFIELIPSLSCFGHLYELLQKPQYKHLQEAEGFEPKSVFWVERMWHHTIDPLNPESYQLIQSLIDQFIPLFRSDKFNICCDETFDLKNGKHKDMDTGELYVGFVTKLIEYLRSRGKQTMMWGDVLHWHPERVDDIPEDVILLNWDYGADAQWSENMIKRFADHGKTQIVCPGTHTWNHFSEKLGSSIPNITNIADLGHKYGAVGVLNTNWGDYGNPCSLEQSQFGLAYGAAKSWNAATVVDDFIPAADMLIYARDGAYKILDRLNQIEDLIRWGDLVWAYSNLLFHKPMEEVSIPEREALLNARQVCEELLSELGAQQWQKENYRQEMLLAAEGLEVIAELLYRLKYGDLARYTDTEQWLSKYSALWLAKNKPSELREIEKMFRYIESSLG